ncbi:MAG: NAD(P)H-dependent oxidoreductase [Alphaproteobacteria bacterium]|nr:NAD(P)H-dependent oxidoreductase [Alphaproteobacteria bacterium]
MPLHLLAISGSLRAGSSNTTLLKAARALAPEGIVVELYEGLGALPHFNPDLDVAPWPTPVVDLRARIGAADGLLICSPEYARGVAGAMKNALDWMVSVEDFAGKPVALFNASPRATHALAALRLTLETMAARVIDAASLTVPLWSAPLSEEGIATDPALAQAVRRALEAMVRA